MENEKLKYLTAYLLSEHSEWNDLVFPTNESEQFHLYRSLVNIRPAVKTAAKATKAKKETVKKAVEAEIKDEVFVQFAGVEINVEAVVAAAKADYKAKGHRTPKTVSVYIKPEEGVAYYTVKGVGSEDYKVEL